MVGQNVGKYRVLDRIGRGGMGTVYRALDETLNREVAIKVLNAELNDPAVAKRFHAEAITVARLSHPGIAIVYELFQHDGQWLMVMEFLRGETLEALIRRKGALPVQQAAELCMQALSALAHAHSLGVVHRDLKPANMILNDAGALKIMDFGIARVAGTEHLTSAGFMMGTPAYMAPEQVMAGEIDARADLYAMGVVLFHLATARLPFKGQTPFELAQSRLYGTPTPVHEMRGDAPAWLGRVLEIALARDPEARYHSAALFREALRRGISDLPLDTPYAGSLPPELIATMAPATLPAVPAATKPVAAAAVVAVPLPGQRSPEASPSTSAETPARGKWLVPAGVAVALVMGLGVWVMMRGPREAAAPPTSIATPAPPPSTDAPPAAPVAPPSAPPPVVTATQPSAAAPPPNSGAAPASAGPLDRGPVGPLAPRPAGRPLGVDPLASFAGIRALVISGRKSEERDAEVRFAAGEITVVDARAGTVLTVLRYRDLVRAIYTRARAPRWDRMFAAPPADLEVSGGGLFRSARHWVVLQSNTTFAILRLNDGDWRQIVEKITERTGIRVDQPAGTL